MRGRERVHRRDQPQLVLRLGAEDRAVAEVDVDFGDVAAGEAAEQRVLAGAAAAEPDREGVWS